MKIDAGNKSIGFIGAGVMGAALIKSLISSSINAAQIYVNEKSDDRAKQVFQLQTFTLLYLLVDQHVCQQWLN